MYHISSGCVDAHELSHNDQPLLQVATRRSLLHFGLGVMTGLIQISTIGGDFKVATLACGYYIYSRMNRR